MEIIKSLLYRIRHTGILFLIGLLLIIYIAFGFLYLQQGTQQREVQAQIVKLAAIVSKPLPSIEELQADYEKVNSALAPMTDSDAIAMLVNIAGKSGIDVDPASGRFKVNPAELGPAKVGEGSYQLLSFKNVQVQGEYDGVMAFITNLDTGETLKTMVLKRVDVSEIEVGYEGEEGERRAEFRQVASAVIDMMAANKLSEIPKPMSYAGGIATNLMRDDPNTNETVEGFPDHTTTAAQKGTDDFTGTMVGYQLYGNEVIVDVDSDGVYDVDDGDHVKLVNYIPLKKTKYYYTCEDDGTVRQWDGPSLATAVEYLGSEEFKIETRAFVDVDIYTKPR